MLLNHRQEIGLQTGKILNRVSQEQIDESPFSRPKMTRDASTRQAVQEGHRLLREQSLQFFSRHMFLVAREA
jgi:hypothetical protein